MIRKLKTKNMPTDPNKKDSSEGKELSVDTSNAETVIPAEILTPRNETGQRVGEVVWPNDISEKIANLSNQLSLLEQNQEESLNSIQNGLVPQTPPNHDKISKEYNKLQISQLKAMQEILDAQKKTKLAEIKVGNIDAEKEISEFNRNRLVEYSKTGAKAIGFTAQYLAKGTLEVAKIGLEVGKLGLLLTKETFKAAAEIWYSLWGAHHEYREKYPNQKDI
jgi:hypothetical protein